MGEIPTTKLIFISRGILGVHLGDHIFLKVGDADNFLILTFF
jgi:hypothetical protein